MGWEQISFAFGFGAASSVGICLATCTPILVAYLITTEEDPRRFVGWVLLFIGVRAATFIVLTLLILGLGRLALDFVREYAFVLRLVGGAAIAGAGALIFFNVVPKLRFFRSQSRGLLFLAVLFGIKPCLPHLGIWGYALIAVGAPMVEGLIPPTEAVLRSAVIGTAFSLGENIVPLAIGVLGGRSIRYFRGRGLRIASRACGAVLFLLGVAFIFYEQVAPVIARIVG
jgi:hypothetical protein